MQNRMMCKVATVLIVMSTICAQCTAQASDCQLDGQWYDPHTTSRDTQVSVSYGHLYEIEGVLIGQ